MRQLTVSVLVLVLVSQRRSSTPFIRAFCFRAAGGGTPGWGGKYGGARSRAFFIQTSSFADDMIVCKASIYIIYFIHALFEFFTMYAVSIFTGGRG